MVQNVAAVASALAQLGWLAVVAFLLFRYRVPLSNLIERMSKFQLKLPNGTTVEITASEAASVAQQLLDEADRLIEDVTTDDQQLLARLHKREPQTIAKLIPGFRRCDESGQPTKELEQLRKLRDCQLLRPLEGGQFHPEKLVVIKPFGRILLRLRPERLLGVSKSA